jgi:hypothetical protein
MLPAYGYDLSRRAEGAVASRGNTTELIPKLSHLWKVVLDLDGDERLVVRALRHLLRRLLRRQHGIRCIGITTVRAEGEPKT